MRWFDAFDQRCASIPSTTCTFLQTGIPVESLLTSESQKLLTMEHALSKRVIGQAPAVNVISNCVRLARAGLHSHKRPMGVFLFLGPTGGRHAAHPLLLCSAQAHRQ
jgi:hypothetical protein